MDVVNYQVHLYGMLFYTSVLYFMYSVSINVFKDVAHPKQAAQLCMNAFIYIKNFIAILPKIPSRQYYCTWYTNNNLNIMQSFFFK